MNLASVAALALAIQSSPAPQASPSAAPAPAAAGTPTQSNLEYSMPIAGSWAYSATPDGSEATFSNESRNAKLTIRCTRSTRRIGFLKAASAASPTMWIWTSSQTKSLPATYDAATGRVDAELAAYDPFLDAIVSSRGRIGFSTSGLEALVVPPWPEVPRVIEDCRV
jgi:hypothetical protein